jgi:putative acyl-CoA dehydrogenase
MTSAALPVFLRYPQDSVQQYTDKIYAQKYDPRDAPLAEKDGATIGMSMTEKQGGSDVRANTTVAVPVGQEEGPGQAFHLTGHKVS